MPPSRQPITSRPPRQPLWLDGTPATRVARSRAGKRAGGAPPTRSGRSSPRAAAIWASAGS